MIDLEQLAPGVQGYTLDLEGQLWVPLVISEDPGQGNVSRYLDNLPRNRTVRFPNVISPRLERMLERRGFRLVFDITEEWGAVPVWERAGEDAL